MSLIRVVLLFGTAGELVFGMGETMIVFPRLPKKVRLFIVKMGSSWQVMFAIRGIPFVVLAL